MSNYINWIVLVLSFIGLGDAAWAQHEGYSDWPAYSIAPSTDGRLVIIDKHGDKKLERARCWVYEFLEGGEKLRLLHHTELLNPVAPLTKFHTICGRFIVTFNEWGAMGNNDRALVIYDLVRNEKSNFAISDFYSEKIVSGLPSHQFIPGVIWTSKSSSSKSYDYSRLELYPNDPEAGNIKTKQRNSALPSLPYIVIDIAARTVRTIEAPEPENWITPSPYHPPKYFKNLSSKKFGWAGLKWEWSTGEVEKLPRLGESGDFPELLKASFVDQDGNVGHWVYRREEDSEYFYKVANNNWIDPLDAEKPE